MPVATILLVEDDDLVRLALRQHLADAGYEVAEADSAARARTWFHEGIDLILLDYQLPDGDGLTLLREIREANPDTVVIMLTSHRNVETAVEVMRAGAYHYMTKPFEIDEVRLQVERALETTALRREVRLLRADAASPYSFEHIIGRSPSMQAVLARLQKIAVSPASTVLLTGESGVGKDLVAKAIHYNSRRAAKPFVNVTCSALPEALLESELFGHERGAFTDARQQKRGLFEHANGGTVFLDEIGEMVPVLQAKLLRVLEERSFRRVGGTADIVVDVRIIAATNKNLAQAVKSGGFREDLYYRLNVLPVAIPPLRERPGDVSALMAFFVDQFNREFGKKVTAVSPEAVRALERYEWPGNVRELRNLVERAMILSESDELDVADFFERVPAHHVADDAPEIPLPERGVNLESLERSFVLQALQRAQGNKTRAAALLGLKRDQIRYRLEKFGLEPGAVAKPD